MALSAPPPSSNILDQLATVPAHTRDGGVPAVGWARLALVLNTLHGVENAVLLIEFADEERLIIDWARGDYWWTTPLSEVPAAPTVTRVRMSRVPGTTIPFVQEQPERLAPLLWTIGLHAFPTESAWWQLPGSRFLVTSWPNFTDLDHDPAHVRMTALLARTPMTPEQLARAARVDPLLATLFVNALDLMGHLEVLPAAAEAPMDVSSPPVSSLFSRLRARLGGSRG